MDFRERINDPQESVRSALAAHTANLWTALPGIIQSVDLGKLTVSVQPSIQAIERTPEGKSNNVNMPVLVDVPIYFPRGGGYTATFPIKAGDECLVVFASRCIDNWWQEGGVQPQFEQRRHDLSDGFALIGPFSQKQVVSNVSSTTAQLRSDDGKHYAEIDKDGQKVRLVSNDVYAELDSGAGIINASAPQEINLRANKIALIGQASVTFTAAAIDVTSQGPVSISGSSSISLNAPTINENG
jgi:hypothetical protein